MAFFRRDDPEKTSNPRLGRKHARNERSKSRRESRWQNNAVFSESQPSTVSPKPVVTPDPPYQAPLSQPIEMIKEPPEKASKPKRKPDDEKKRIPKIRKPVTVSLPTAPTPSPVKAPISAVKGANVKEQKPTLVSVSKGLQVQHLGKRYSGRPVVRDVSLYVQRGEAVGLLGPNGAGKTTSFYMITGLVSSDIGKIMLDGEDISHLPMYRRARLGIGYLPQEASIFRGLSVEQNIMAVLEVIEPDPAVRSSRLDELLAEFSITHLRHSPAVTLSGGERRRVEIARALASKPSFILLDEPLAGIDPIAVEDVREIVSHLKDRGIGVLITDHNVRETLDIIDRAYIMHDGTVLMEGTPAEIVNNSDVRRVYLGERFSL